MTIARTEQPLIFELQSQATISLYLRRRYDLSSLFEYYPDWKSVPSGQSGYTAGDIVWHSVDNGSYSSFLYKAARYTVGNPDDDADSWELTDPRNPSIGDWMVTLFIIQTPWENKSHEDPGASCCFV